MQIKLFSPQRRSERRGRRKYCQVIISIVYFDAFHLQYSLRPLRSLRLCGEKKSH
jgi:ATP-dependent helicase YprA (DUF1998 family)